MTIDYYKTKFVKLRIDVKPHWPRLTFHHAPYKPMLLLAIMDLVAQQIIDVNMISLNADLTDAFDLYWTQIVGNSRANNPVMPFMYMRSEGFWHLVDIHGEGLREHNLDRNELFRRIKNQALFAQLDEELFALLQSSESRDTLRRALIEEYFDPEARPIITKVSHITTESFEYSRELLNRSRGRFVLQGAPPLDEQFVAEARSAGFRRTVVHAYDQTCAICGVRIVTPEGTSAVEAAHIVPWRHSHNNDPRNGLALCGLHHWIFDAGLVGITTAYTVKVSPVLRSKGQQAETMLLLDGNKMYRPADQVLLPDRAALRWHMNKIFRPLDPQILV